MAVIRLGLAVSLSGRYALLGQQVLNGVQAFIAYANNAAGADQLGFTDRLELVFIDDESRESGITNAYQTLFNTHSIDILLGPYGSGLGVRAAQIADEQQVLLWNHSSSADHLFDESLPWQIGIISPASNYYSGVIELLQQLPTENIALLCAKTGFAQEIGNGLESIVERDPTHVMRFDYEPDTEDFSQLLRGALALKPDTLLGAGRVEDDLRLAQRISQLRQSNAIKLDACALIVAGIDNFQQTLGDLAERFLAPSQWEPKVTHAVDYGPTVEQFRSVYRTITEQAIDYPAAQGFAGALIALCCVIGTGSTEARALRDYARTLRCRTFYGSFAIDPATGAQIGHEMLVTQWQDGARRIVWPRAVAETTARFPFSK